MKEYEYIIVALEGYISDELTGVICSENYRNRTYDHGYRYIFNEYRKLHKDFEKRKEEFTNPEYEQKARENFQIQCVKKSTEIRDAFLKDIQSCSNFDMKQYMRDYLKKLENEEYKTTVKRICVYPYLVSILRRKGNGGKIYGEKV